MAMMTQDADNSSQIHQISTIPRQFKKNGYTQYKIPTQCFWEG